jgi:hypothetical protein
MAALPFSSLDAASSPLTAGVDRFSAPPAPGGSDGAGVGRVVALARKGRGGSPALTVVVAVGSEVTHRKSVSDGVEGDGAAAGHYDTGLARGAVPDVALA